MYNVSVIKWTKCFWKLILTNSQEMFCLILFIFISLYTGPQISASELENFITLVTTPDWKRECRNRMKDLVGQKVLFLKWTLHDKSLLSPPPHQNLGWKDEKCVSC